MSVFVKMSVFFEFITGIVRLLVVFPIIVPLSKCYDNLPHKQPCGTLYFEPNYQGDNFTLVDEYQAVNLPEDQRAPNESWSTTGSLKVFPACKMAICNETYFDGECKTLQSGSYPNSIFSHGNFQSATCFCDRVCKCSDVYMKKSSCARAYLEGGCKACNSLYTDLIGEKLYFPQEFKGKVESILVRQGCELTLFDEEDLDGNSITIDKQINEDLKATFASYECKCNDSKYEPRIRPRRPDSLPTLLNIPYKLDDVIRLLKNKTLSSHPGLRAALSSLRNGRSSRNAYVLLLGTTGAGKSSAINLLFGNPNVTRAGDGKSTTSNIHEFRIPVAVDEIGVANSELRVIDTPGLGDTKGLMHDAKYLTSLDLYLSQHEELHNKIPNVVLIFHKFDDNRFDGVGSTFVKMIRALDAFRERITDDSYSNVIFVLSHFCKANKADQKKPDKRLKMFRQVIENFSLFPRPTIIVVAENRPWDEELPSYNGYFKLPNNEFYPRNLFEKMQLVTKNGGDPIGGRVFQTAFRDSETFNISQSTFNLVSEGSSKVPYYLSILTNAAFGIEKTQISQKLQDVWDNSIDVSMQKEFPSSLSYLQKTLNLRHINSEKDVPKTTTEILQFLTVIKQDKATRTLLDKALGIKPPVFTQNVVAGYSYNVFQDEALPASPLQMGTDMHMADIGFLIPNEVTCSLEPSTKEIFIVHDDKSEYLRDRLESLGIKGSIDESRFTSQVKPGHNIKSGSFKNDSCSVSAITEVRIFQFILNDRVDLSQEFRRTVKTLPVFNESDYDSVEMWKTFFQTYGTHVVHSVYGGGSIEVKLQSDKPFDETTAEALYNVVQFAKDMAFEIDGEDGEDTFILREGTDHTLTFRGGDFQYHTRDLTALSVEMASTLMKNWKRSLKFNPVVLSTEMRLVPVSQLARQMGQNYSQEIERAAKLHFNSTLKYISEKNSKNITTVPPPRPQTLYEDHIKMFLKAQEESSKRLNEMMEKMAKMQLAMERQRNDLVERRQAWEVNQKQLEFEMKRREWEAKNMAEKERLNWQKEMAAQRSKSEKERQEENKKYQAELLKIQQESAKRMEAVLKIIATRTPTVVQKKCLKPGTKILMGDLSERNVEEVNVGDLVLDMDLNPVSVLSVNSQFLESAKLYGFDKKSYFFTEEHVFVGPARITEGNSPLRLYAQSSATLYRGNPLMKYLNVSDMHREGMEPFRIFHLDKNGTRSVLARDVNVYEDSHNYPANMPVYYIQVGGPSGTYFANGHVCRHGTPPFEYWPNTMSLLFRFVNTERFRDLAGLPYSSNTENYLNRLTDLAAWNVGTYLGEYDWKSEVQDENESYQIMTLGDVDLPRIISELFSSATGSALGEQLYVKVGQLIAPYLDGELDGNNENAGLILNENQVAGLQHRLFNVIYET